MWYTGDLEFDFDLEHHRNQIGNNNRTKVLSSVQYKEKPIKL